MSNCSSLYGGSGVDAWNGGYLTLANFKDVSTPKGGFATNLTKSQKENIERGFGGIAFKVLIQGRGWADARGADSFGGNKRY
jgi:hypothetical protein